MILPTHLIYLDQIVLSEFGFSGIDVVDDLAEMIDVAFRVERVGGNLKGNAVLPGNFFGENRECRCHRKSHLGANLFHAAFQVWVHPEVHIDCICHSNTPLS